MFIHDENNSRRFQKTPPKIELRGLQGGRPHLQAGQPSGAICQPLHSMSVLHRLKDHIYAVDLSQFDPRVRIDATTYI
jgi:hypothetical protein